MITWNGQYSTKYLDKLSLKMLYTDALKVSTKALCDTKDDRYRRIIDPHITPKDWIDTYLSTNTHNTVFNRYEYNSKLDWAEQEGEFGSCTMGLEYDRFLWIYVSLEDLEILVKKYNLIKL